MYLLALFHGLIEIKPFNLGGAHLLKERGGRLGSKQQFSVFGFLKLGTTIHTFIDLLNRGYYMAMCG